MRFLTLVFVFCLVLGCQVCLAQGDPAAAEETAAAEAEMMMPAEGGISFIEIPSTDLAASQDFYGGLFGWAFEEMMEGFVMFSGPDETMGAFSTTGVVAEGGPMLYITVGDVAATLEAITAAGGEATSEPMVLPEGWGTIGMFKDPSGNTLGIWSAT